MTEVETHFKPFGSCEGNQATCTNRALCPLEGNLIKPDKNGKRRVRGCKDAGARGKTSRKSGLASQTRAAKALGVPMIGSMRPGNEEHYTGLVRMEAKSGAQVGPLYTAYLRAELQSEQQRPIGDTRPFVMAARQEPHAKDGLIVIRESALLATVYALGVQLGLIEGSP